MSMSLPWGHSPPYLWCCVTSMLLLGFLCPLPSSAKYETVPQLKVKPAYSLKGKVAPGSFALYTLDSASSFTALLLQLTSVHGDVDLYVKSSVDPGSPHSTSSDKRGSSVVKEDSSTTSKTVSFYNYDLKSDTYGIDLIELPRSFRLPASVGIYGHPTSLNHEFILDVYQLERSEDDYERIRKEMESRDEFSYDELVQRLQAYPTDVYDSSYDRHSIRQSSYASASADPPSKQEPAFKSSHKRHKQSSGESADPNHEKEDSLLLYILQFIIQLLFDILI